MSSLKQTLAVLLAIGLAYFWLSTPSLSYYSLQAFALATLGFFISKRAAKAQLWHILPTAHSIEIVFISFAVILLVGSTGNANSIFYPFGYIHLFFLVMTTRQSTAITATIATMLVHYAIEPTITATSIATLTTLPLMLLFFLFARRQYDDARLQQKIAETESIQLDSISNSAHTLESFISQFLQPKLAVLKDIIEVSIHRNEPIDPHMLDTQITLMGTESQKIIETAKSEKKVTLKS